MANSTLKYNVNASAIIGEPRFMRGERSMILFPLAIEGHSEESFAVNMHSKIGKQIACDDLRLAVPELLAIKDDDELLATALTVAAGKEVVVFKTQQKNDPSKYNLRLKGNLAKATKADLLALVKSMSAPNHDDDFGGFGAPPSHSDEADANPST